MCTPINGSIRAFPLYTSSLIKPVNYLAHHMASLLLPFHKCIDAKQVRTVGSRQVISLDEESTALCISTDITAQASLKQIRTLLRVSYFSFSGVPLHQVVALILFFLVRNNPGHPEQKPGSEVLHPEVRVAPGRGVELTRM